MRANREEGLSERRAQRKDRGKNERARRLEKRTRVLQRDKYDLQCPTHVQQDLQFPLQRHFPYTALRDSIVDARRRKGFWNLAAPLSIPFVLSLVSLPLHAPLFSSQFDAAIHVFLTWPSHNMYGFTPSSHAPWRSQWAVYAKSREANSSHATYALWATLKQWWSANCPPLSRSCAYPYPPPYFAHDTPHLHDVASSSQR